MRLSLSLWLPVSLAYRYGLLNVVELLLEKGAVPNDGLNGPVAYLNSLGLPMCMNMLSLLIKHGHGVNVKHNAAAMYFLSTKKIDKLDDKICIFRFLAEQPFSTQETYFDASLLQQTLHLFPEGFKILIEKGVNISDVLIGPLLPQCTHRLQDPEICRHMERAMEMDKKINAVVKKGVI